MHMGGGRKMSRWEMEKIISEDLHKVSDEDLKKIYFLVSVKPYL